MWFKRKNKKWLKIDEARLINLDNATFVQHIGTTIRVSMCDGTSFAINNEKSSHENFKFLEDLVSWH